MLAELKRGIQILGAGVIGSLRGDQDGSLVVAPSLLEAVLEGRVFSVANQAGVALTAALATTWTGLGVANPSTSGKNMIVHKFGVSGTIANSADGAIGLMFANTTGFTTQSIVPQNRKLGGPGSSMLTSAGATIGTPILLETGGSVGTLAVTGYSVIQPVKIDVDGTIIVPPGYAIMSYSTKAINAGPICHFVYEERPV